MSDLPLDETALQAAAKVAQEDVQYPHSYDRLLISTYLREAKFEVVNETSEYGAKLPYPVVGPWKLVPVVQAESEGE